MVFGGTREGCGACSGVGRGYRCAVMTGMKMAAVPGNATAPGEERWRKPSRNGFGCSFRPKTAGAATRRMADRRPFFGDCSSALQPCRALPRSPCSILRSASGARERASNDRSPADLHVPPGRQGDARRSCWFSLSWSNNQVRRSCFAAARWPISRQRSRDQAASSRSAERDHCVRRNLGRRRPACCDGSATSTGKRGRRPRRARRSRP